MKGLDKKFWASLFIFGLAGQIAWTIENMYLNVFIYKMFNASASDISFMVAASAIVATITTWLMGALSDYFENRKWFICIGYILWGISIFGFRVISNDAMPFVYGIQLAIGLDCVMTFFGSTANDAAYNAWLTDRGDASNRGAIEGYNAILPIISMMIVFGACMGLNLDLPKSWQMIFSIIGISIFIIGLLGIVLIEESEIKKPKTSLTETLFYSLKKEVILNNKMLYMTLVAFTIFATSINVFMPYLLLYYEQGLHLANYVMIFAPATLIAALLTKVISGVYDMQGLKLTSTISVSILMAGYIVLTMFTNTACVFIGTLLIMVGYMSTLSVFGAEVRSRIPENKSGQFQGIRMICQVMIPGVFGPMLGSLLLKNADVIINNDGTTSFIPNRMIFVGAFLVGIVLCFILNKIYLMMRTEHYDLMSQDTKDYLSSKALPWQEHPRPQMKREAWCSLNGEWKLEDKEIIVPFAPQSMLSNYKGDIKDVMTYQKTFMIPENFTKDRVLLHFGAVDQICDVYVNGKEIGHHEGGYLPFTFDITHVVDKGKENNLTVVIKDDLSLDYPYGKQCAKRGGMWYTPISGIWQSVWLENVNNNYIKNIKITPDLNGVNIELQGEVSEFEVVVEVAKYIWRTFKFKGNKGRIKIDNPIHWTCENPYLYPMTIITKDDQIESYFALRTIGFKHIEGIKRVVLNNQPIFMHGLLDQGYYCDGIYLPATQQEYERDILRMKELGFNLLRKHIKVEPEAFYYYCDLHGMLVMQDFVNNGKYDFIKDTVIPTFVSKNKDDTKCELDTKAHQIFLAHSKQLVKHLYNHPCIVSYTIFNEGWGQFHSDYVYDLVKTWDKTRIIDSTSGWFWQHKNEFDSHHIYMKEIECEVKDRPYFISECGGFTMNVDHHIYSKYNVYGYGVCESKEELTQKIVSMYEKMVLPGIKKGVCGCIYTQVSDVEDEINGLYTYDRYVCKVDKKKMQKVAYRLKKAVK